MNSDEIVFTCMVVSVVMLAVASLSAAILWCQYTDSRDRKKRTSLLLDRLADGKVAGAVLQRMLDANSLGLSGPSFYRLMSQLEQDGFVYGWYKSFTIDGQPVKERWYMQVKHAQEPSSADQ